jgi:putative transposase
VSHDAFSETHLHIVWHTKLSMPLLTPPIEAFVHHYVRHRLLAEPGVLVHAIGGTENHVHVAITVPPTLLVSELVGRIKGGCAHEANQRFGATEKVLEWQRGYGIVSFGTRNIPWVRAYIEKQRQHHARHTIQERLERVSGPDEKETS